MKGIVAWCIAVIILWGLWAFLFKIGSSDIGIKNALFYAYLTGIILSLAIVAYSFPENFEIRKGVLFIILSTVIGFAGTIIWYVILQKHKASIITSFTALYPVVTVLLSILILKEKLSLPNAIGILLALAAGILLSM
jgi:transporter family protein